MCAAAAKSLQSCPTLCDPINGSPPGSPVPGILQARTLEWVAISFPNAWKWKVKVKSFSRVRLLATSWTAVYQAPLSMGFSREEYWSEVPSPSPNVRVFIYIYVYSHYFGIKLLMTGYIRFTCGDFLFCSFRVAGLCNFLKLSRGFLTCMSKVRDIVVLCASIYTSLCIVYFLPCTWLRTASLRTVSFSSLSFSLTIWR